jgi:hypothetical protein
MIGAADMIGPADMIGLADRLPRALSDCSGRLGTPASSGHANVLGRAAVRVPRTATGHHRLE